MAELDSEIQESSDSTSSNNPMMMIIVLVIVVLVAAGGYFWWKNRSVMAPPLAPAGESLNQDQSLDQMANDSMMAQASPSATIQSSEGIMEDGVRVFDVEGGSFYFDPNEMHAKVGDKIRVNLTGKDMVHDYVIDELNVKSKQIKTGESTMVEFTVTKPGTYEYYCSVGKHRQMGMVGKLIVE